MATTDKILIINPNTGEVVEQRDIAAKAENVSIVPAGNITDTNLQDVLEDMDSRIGQGGGSSPSSASGVSYDNTESELEATDVQSAIDEVNEVAQAAMTAASASPSGVPTAFERNRHRGSVLFSQARYFYMSGGNTYRLPQFLIVTDNHNDRNALQNALNLAAGFPSIMCVFQLGDLVSLGKLDGNYGESIISSSTKPVYSVLGNHDVGNSNLLHRSCDNSYLYEKYVQPMVTKGWLKSGEYVNGKAYWCHDITYYDRSASAQRTLRVIGVNEYDYPDWANDEATMFGGTWTFNNEVTGPWWEPITYDSSYQTMEYSHSYTAGDCVNVSGYTKFSFRCNLDCTTPAQSGNEGANTKVVEGVTMLARENHAPKYKYTRGAAYISQAQAQWLVNLLETAPANSSIVVLMHQQIDSTITFHKSLKFCANSPYSNRSMVQSSNVLYTLLNAFVNGTSGTLTTTAGSGLPAISVNYDFTALNTNVKLCPIMAGHTHCDEIITKGSLVQLTSINTGSSRSGGPDIEKGWPYKNNGDGYGYITDDCVNVVTFDPTNKVVKLCKLGATFTVDGYERDQEEINWDTLTTPIYGDKQVKEKIDELSE